MLDFLPTPIRTLYAVPQRVIVYAGSLGRFRQRDAAPFGVNHNIVSSVTSLFLCCRPSAIFRRVVGIVVDAFKHQTLAPRRQHIGLKVANATAPLWAHAYTSPAVSRVILIGRAIAAAQHRSPHLIQGFEDNRVG